MLYMSSQERMPSAHGRERRYKSVKLQHPFPALSLVHSDLQWDTWQAKHWMAASVPTWGALQLASQPLH